MSVISCRCHAEPNVISISNKQVSTIGGSKTVYSYSLIIYEENTRKITTVAVALYLIKFYVNLHFSFDFHGLDNVDFENYFNETWVV